MRAGDLIEHKTIRYRVHRTDRMTRMATLMALDGTRCEVPDNLDRTSPDECRVICNLSETWQTAVVPIKSGAGPIVKLVLPTLRNSRELVRWQDWAESDALREGGSIFINPVLGIKPGDILIATHKSGTATRITISSSFGTVKEKIARAEKPKEVRKKTIADRILDDDE